ncbi:MAG: O-antigen ligase family protein [Planctomycetales bacterium]|nr:O-antigen ligase family protein [Planctomycetales bacterium]
MQNRQLNLGMLYLLMVPIGAALVHFLDFSIGNFRFSGWLWMMYFLAGAFLFQAEIALNRQSRVDFPWLAWLPWVAYLWMSLTWCDGLAQRNIQDAMQITVPLSIAVVASMFGRRLEHLRLYITAIVVTLVILLVRVAMIRLHIIVDEDRTGARIFSITAVFLASVAVALTHVKPTRGYLMWAACLAVAAGTGSRTTTGVILLLPVLNPLNRNWMVKGTLLGATCLAGIGLFYTPQFQQRFFYDGHGTLTQLVQGDFLSFGRFEAWPAIFAKAQEHGWFGAGVGEVTEFVPTVWPEEDKPHNDYLRLFFETGIIGFTLFWSTMYWQYRNAVRRALATDGLLRAGFGAAALGIIGFAILCLTDNVLIYNLYYNNMLFGMLGLCYGVAAASANGVTNSPETVTSKLAQSPVLPTPWGQQIGGGAS